MTDVLSVDFETYSECDLRACGVHKYAADPSTDILCLAWAMNLDEPQLWLPGDPLPESLVDHVLMGGDVQAWNAQFERLLWLHVFGPRYGAPIPHLRQYRCTMVRALAMGFPGSLDMAGPAIGLDIKKDAAGGRVMMQLSKPRKTKLGLTRWLPEHHPHKFQQLYAYCLQDVRVEQAIGARVVQLIPAEQDLYWRDQAVNDRGVTVDMPLVEACREVVDQQLDKLDREMREVTGKAVSRTTNVAQLKEWLIASGLTVDSLDKDHIIRLLARDDLTNSQRVALLLRQEAGKTSTAKLDSFAARVCEDGTIKGTIQFHGASTGRDAARGVQVQNFPRPSKGFKADKVIPDLMMGDAAWIDVMHGPPMTVVSDTLRSIISAAPGKDLVSADLSQIEARETSYLSGQQHMVDAFRAVDDGTGPDIYIIAAAGIYDVPAREITTEDPRRQVGKVSTLALGFGGGAGAFASMAKIYQVDVSTMYGTVWEIATPENREKALAAWKDRGKSSGLRREGWLASELVKLAWRDSNPDTVRYWRDLENASIDALMNPGEVFTVRGIQFRKTGSFLRCRLHSGRSLFYPFPSIEMADTPWGDKKPSMRFWGLDGYTRKWKRFASYGGFLCQNIVQATARDVMFEGLVRLETMGYENVMRVHDEIICQVDEGQGDLNAFIAAMIQPPKWAPGLPIAASGWIGKRYRK